MVRIFYDLNFAFIKNCFNGLILFRWYQAIFAAPYS